MTDWQIDEAPYQHWIKNVEIPWRNSLKLPDFDRVNEGNWPLISIVVPTYNTPSKFLSQAIESVLNQNYIKWELCVADDASTEPDVREVIRQYLESDSRIRATFREVNGGIAAATNSALTLATGQYIAFLDHDDLLPEYALFLVAQELRSHADTRILYSDSDNLNVSGERCNPFFKPDWNYDLLLGQNYLNHLSVYCSKLLKNIGGLREGFEGSQDYDLALRAIENIPPGQIRHLPHILYHWRVLPSSVSQSNLGQAVKAGRKAVAEHLDRSHQRASVNAPKNAIIYNRVNWASPTPQQRILILVHGKDSDLLRESVVAIRKTTDYDYFHVKELATGGALDHLPLGAVLNKVIDAADEDLICIVPGGFYPESTNWLQGIAGHLTRSMVGVVGVKVMSAKGGLVSGPVVPGLESLSDNTQLGRAFEGASPGDKGYFGRLALDHQVSAVHGACLVTQRLQLTRVAGFNPVLSNLALLGADLSFKLQEQGLATVWSANALMRCADSVAQATFRVAASKRELAHFQQLWSHRMQRDPCYNSNFSRSGISYRLPS